MSGNRLFAWWVIMDLTNNTIIDVAATEAVSQRQLKIALSHTRAEKRQVRRAKRPKVGTVLLVSARLR